MKKYIVGFVGLLLVIGYTLNWYKSLANNPISKPHFQKKKIAALPYVKRVFPGVPPSNLHRVPASFGSYEPVKNKLNVRLGKNPIKIGKSFNVVDGVATLQKEKYKREMGKKIYENDHYVFFQPTTANTDAWPVALDGVNQKLYPISHVLHVKSVDADLRAQFVAEGMQEFYYNTRLKFMFLETSPSTVIQQFQTLTARGFDVRLEVLRETPTSR